MAKEDTRKTVLITGCSPGGIGHELCHKFNDRGLRVLATARNKRTIYGLESLGIETFDLDVTSADSIAALKQELQALLGGKLDYLVNNAGRNYTVPATDIDFDEVKLTFETNVYAPMRMCQAFAPFLIASKGTIVQIGSVAGIIPYVFGSVYNASKAALHNYSNTLRVELAPFDVDVVTVITGGVQSRIARTKRDLPPGSIYVPIDEHYQRRVGHSQVDGSMSRELYARSVVKQVLDRGNKPLYIWEGNRVFIVWLVSSFLPMWLFDIWMARNFGLRLLAGPTKQKRA